MDFELEVNGFQCVASYSEESIENVCKPLICRWMKMYKGHRLVVLLAAPPGTGKTTLSCMLEKLASDMGLHLQSIGMDGFHYSNEYLKSHTVIIDGKEVTLSSIKGMPETFDVDSLSQYLQDLKSMNPQPWPLYSRLLHNPVKNACQITGDVILVEGNYLLLDRPKWKNLNKYVDDTIFIHADADFLKERLIDRKVKGGLLYQEALAWYESVDGKNIDLVLNHSLPASIQIDLKDNEFITKNL